RMNCFLGLELGNHLPLNQEVCTKAALQVNAFVDDWYGLLPFHAQPQILQCIGDTRFIRRFEQAWAKRLVNFDRRTDYRVGNVVKVHGITPRSKPQRTQRDAEKTDHSSLAFVRRLAFSAFLRALCGYFYSRSWSKNPGVVRSDSRRRLSTRTCRLLAADGLIPSTWAVSSLDSSSKWRNA